MTYDHAFVRAVARARVDRLIAEADAFRAARALAAGRVRRRVPGWLRWRRRAAAAVPPVPPVPPGPPVPSIPRPRSNGPQ